MDSKEYLQPGFNPNKLTIPNLRSIMLDHNIEYPSSAKKSELVQMFQTHITPNAEGLLERESKIVEPSSEGISFYNEESATAARRPKRSRKSATPQVEELQSSEENPDTASGSPFSNRNVFQIASKESTPNKQKSTELSELSDDSAKENGLPITDRNDFQSASKKTTPKKQAEFASPLSKVESTLPLKRGHEQEGQPKKKKLHRRKKDASENSFASDDAISPAMLKAKTLTPNKSILNQERFEDNADDIFNKSSMDNSVFLRLSSASNTPVKPKKAVNILEGYNKTVPSGRISKKENSKSSKKVKKVIEKQLKEKDENVHIEPDSIQMEEFEFDEIQTLDAEMEKDITAESYYDEFATPSLTKVSVIPTPIKADSSLQESSGPKRKISIESFRDDEGTIKDFKMNDDDDNDRDDEVVYKETATDRISINSGDDSKTDVEYEDEEGHEIELSPNDETPVMATANLDEDMEETEVPVTKNSKSWLASLLKAFTGALLLSAGFGGFGLYREMKLNVGYCGLGSSNNAKPLDLLAKLPSSLVESYPGIVPYINSAETYILDNFKPSCVTCPEDAICYKNSKIVCDADYKIDHPWNSIFGLIPNMETCEFDTMKSETIRLMTQYTLNVLHKREGKELTLEELHDFLKATKSDSMTNQEFEEYWHNFINFEISQEPYVKVDFQTSSISIEHKVPTQFLTRTLGYRKNKEKTKLFSKYPVPTSTFGGYSNFKDTSFTKVEVEDL